MRTPSSVTSGLFHGSVFSCLGRLRLAGSGIFPASFAGAVAYRIAAADGFFGGVDQANLTGRTLEVLLDSVLADLSVDVVLGLYKPSPPGGRTACASQTNTTLHSSLPSLAGLIARADLGIGAGGITTRERACLGLPALVVPCAANQIEGVQALEKENCIINVSTEKFEKALCNSLDKVVANQAWLYSASTKSVDFADGHGTDRGSTKIYVRVESLIRFHPYVKC